MSKTRILSCNFGASYVSLSTVGYTIYNERGDVQNARQTAGVGELGTATGIYYANIDLPDDFEGIVVWDTGGATPVYGLEPNSGQLNTIQNDTDQIRLIWNTLRNQGVVYTKLIDKINGIDIPEQREYTPVLEEIKRLAQEIKAKEYPKLSDIEKAVNLPAPIVNLPAPIVNIPEVKIPDYTQEINNIKNAMSELGNLITKIPTEQKDYTTNLSELKNVVQRVFSKIDDMTNTFIDDMSLKLSDLSGQLNTSINSQWMKSAKKDDVERLLRSIGESMAMFNSAYTSLSALIKSVDDGITGKVENGYLSVVDKKKKALSANRLIKQMNKIRLGLGLKNG